MRKLLMSLVLVFSFATVASVYVPSTTVSVEAKEKKKKKKIFDMTWKGFKKKWKKEMTPYDKKLSKIKNLEVSESLGSIRYDGRVKEVLFVSVNTKSEKSKKIGYAEVVVPIRPDSKNDIEDAVRVSSMLIKITDPTISIKKKQSIFRKKLQVDGVFENGEIHTYSYNGVLYKAEYAVSTEGITLATISVLEE